jgi:multicomponent Na+:H+ antiporter subunit G
VLGLLFLAAVLQLLTAPVAAHMVGRTAYRTRQVDEDSLIVDELADDLARAGFRPAESTDDPESPADS